MWSPFDLNPGQANTNFFINYTYGTNIKLFNYSTEKLQEIFDGEYEVINLFNEKLLEISKNPGWMETGSNTIMVKDTNGNQMNLISKYGRITIDKIRFHAPT